MNTKKVLLVFGVLVILIGLVVALLFMFLGIYNQSQGTADEGSLHTPTGDPIAYLKDHWQFYDGEWDAAANTVTAIRNYDLTYEEAQKIGNRVFNDELSPESYLSQALTIAADLSSRFSMEGVTVVISFRGNDNRELFSVDSKGNISTCWTIEE